MSTEVTVNELKDFPADILQSVQEIAASWRKSTEAIIETGNLLNQAESKFTHEQYSSLRDYLITEVGMSNSVISKLKTIARNPILIDPNYHHRLPPSYATLYQISKIEEDKLKNALDEGEITSLTQLKDVTAKFGSLTRKPRKKNDIQTNLTVTFSGDLAVLDVDLLRSLREVLASLQQHITVKTRGI